MSKSEEIRLLLQSNPGITPARLRDILKARGVEVDTHLIRVVRRNWIAAGRPPEKQPPSPAEIQERKRRAREYARLWVERKKEREAKEVEANQLAQWRRMWWDFAYHATNEFEHNHHFMQVYHLQQAALQRGAFIPPEDYVECPDCPDLVTIYVELIFQICTGKLTYGDATRLIAPLLEEFSQAI